MGACPVEQCRCRGLQVRAGLAEGRCQVLSLLHQQQMLAKDREHPIAPAHLNDRGFEATQCQVFELLLHFV